MIFDSNRYTTNKVWFAARHLQRYLSCIVKGKDVV